MRDSYRNDVPAKCVGRTTSQDWFADEIAIDFPSLDSLLDRIRQSFFGLEDATSLVSAEILLTEDEANAGVVIPLDVPVKRTCPACGGRGESWSDLCGVCAGSGEASGRHRVRLSVPRGTHDGARMRLHLQPSYTPPTVLEVRIAIR